MSDSQQSTTRRLPSWPYNVVSHVTMRTSQQSMVCRYVDDLDPTGEARLAWDAITHPYLPDEREARLAEIAAWKREHPFGFADADVLVYLDGVRYFVWLESGRVEDYGDLDHRDCPCHGVRARWEHFAHCGDVIPLTDPVAQRAIELVIGREITWVDR